MVPPAPSVNDLRLPALSCAILPAMQLFGDEAGNPGDFSDRPDDRHFMVVTVSLSDSSWLSELDRLAVELRERFEIPALGAPFHASRDRPEVIREVLTRVASWTPRIDATIVDKRRLTDWWRERRRLYAGIWAEHLVRLLPQFRAQHAVEVVVASIGTGRDLRAFRRGADRAVAQAAAEAATYSSVLGLGVLGRMTLGTGGLVVTGRAGVPQDEPGLQVADCCAWAIHRRWERPTEAAWAYGLIADSIASERLIDFPAADA